MKKTARKGLEALRSPKPCHSKGLDDLFRKLTAIEARKRGFEVQLKNSSERTNSLTEILQKIQKEEAELTNRLKLSEDFPSGSDKGAGKEQYTPPETARTKGKEMVFRF
ncbi:MAG TPA: hypothetical protein ACFYD3_03815 [Candidatus Hypogeohydataceae bacterium YC41]